MVLVVNGMFAMVLTVLGGYLLGRFGSGPSFVDHAAPVSWSSPSGVLLPVLLLMMEILHD